MIKTFLSNTRQVRSSSPKKGFQWLLEFPVATGNDNITNSEYTIWSWNVREGLNLFNKSGKAGQLARNNIL
jgi:hypothetical protein